MAISFSQKLKAIQGSFRLGRWKPVVVTGNERPKCDPCLGHYLLTKLRGKSQFLALWSDLETRKYEMGNLLLKAVRFVSFGAGPDHWAGRLEFLGRKKYVQSTGCLYESHKTLDTLLDWREADRDGSGWYGYLMAQLSEAHQEEHNTADEFDPILVYLAQTPCDCAVGHAHKAGFYDEEDLDLVDLRKVLKLVSKVKALGDRPPW